MTLSEPDQLEAISEAVDQGLDALIIDDIERFLGEPELEAQLFALYNQMRDLGKRWYVSASCAPRDLTATLPDLLSRLAWGGIYKLPRLVDEELLEALRLRSNARGLTMSDEVGRYILYHGPRDAKAMFDALDSLDTASLAHQRKLSIPFIKAQLNW
jgi:DnaA family protein